MSYHVEAPRFGFKELPDRILVREDGAYGASKEHGEPIIDHWYVPEQAIAATLGAGTCHNTSYRLDESRFHCSECEFGCWVKDVSDGRDKLPRFCPNCGRRIVEVDE